MNEYQVIECWDDMDIVLKIPVTLSVETEGGSEFALKLDPGKYHIVRYCQEPKNET